MSLWSQNKESSVGGMNLSEIVTYYLVITIIGQIVSPHIDWDVVNDINKGTLSFYLVRPYKYFLQLFIQEIPWKLITYIINIFPLTLFIIFYKKYLFLPSISISKIVFVILLCIASYLLMFLIEFTLGSLAFWITEIRALIRTLYMTLDLFSGRLFPLVLMPQVLTTLGKYLPFQYLWYYPTMIILDKQDLIDARFGILIVFFWIAIIGILLFIIWKKGIKSYSSYGG